MPKKMKIYTFPETVLRTRTSLVVNIDEDTQSLIDCMAETMYSAPGIGLAANQVGKSSKILVYDLTPTDEGRNLNVLINPEIVLSEDTMEGEESCLSVIDFSAEIKRSAFVKIRGVDRDGNPLEIEAEDLLARCLQHEIDHLNGVLFIDHVSSLKRSLYKKRLKKIIQSKSEAES